MFSFNGGHRKLSGQNAPDIPMKGRTRDLKMNKLVRERKNVGGLSKFTINFAYILYVSCNFWCFKIISLDCSGVLFKTPLFCDELQTSVVRNALACPSLSG